MKFRFDNMIKIPDQPAARMLAMANAKLLAQLPLPASASVPEVLQALADEEELFDMIQLLAVALPPREAVWWACLAARDLVGQDEKSQTPSLIAAERWVFKPDAENRAAAQNAMDLADIDDDTVYCAMATVYANGNMGEGDLAEIEAPPNALSTAVFVMNMNSVAETLDTVEDHAEMLIARALDIARGGNGTVERQALADNRGAI